MRHLQLISLIGLSILLAGCGGSGSGAKNDSAAKGDSKADKAAASSGGGKGFAQKVLDMDEKTYVGGLRKSGSRKGDVEIKRLFDSSNRLSAGPLAKNGGVISVEKSQFPPGTMADAFQALLMLRPAQWLYGNTDLYGDCYQFGLLDLPPSMYKSVFGDLDNLTDANRSGRKARWQLTCTDGTLRFVGEVIPNRLVRIENVIVN